MPRTTHRDATSPRRRHLQDGMKLSVIIWFAVLAACGFGDNNLGGGPTRHRCGDGVVDVGEGCDDGNTLSGDGCSSTCQVETSDPVCGNGVLEVGEECDDGNMVSGDGCSSTCKHESVCGNGVVEPGEQCDDGNTISGDGCSPSCQLETSSSCSVFPQGGCGGATPACDVDDAGDTGCRAVTEAGTSNDHCTVDTACKAGYTCMHDSTHPELTPLCARFCVHDGDCNGVGARCVDGLADSQGHPLNIFVCSNSCDPYHQTGCPSAMGCVSYYGTGGAKNYTDCIYTGNHPDGAACTSDYDCAAGSVCVSDSMGSNAKCYASCIVGEASTCAAGTCASFATAMTIGTVEYGFCQ
jgi:cysteine-rich repeat protein